MDDGRTPVRVHADVHGAGPDVVLLVHGVGFGPSTMASVASLLAEGATVVVPHRRGYGVSAGLPATPGVAAQVADMVDLLDRMGLDRIHVVGVSGGATIGLALAAAHPARVASAVLHEPAAGPLGAGVWHLLQDLAETLSGITEPIHAGRLYGRTLAGPAAWAALPVELRDEVAGLGGIIRDEVPSFAAFAPGPDELARLRGRPIVTTLGVQSGESRRETAQALLHAAGARVVALPGCGHLAQIESPAALAEAAAGVRRRRAA